jgi:hypothetical protein
VGFTDRMFDALYKMTGPAREQTVVDDARSRVARKQQVEQARMTREEYDPDTGKQLLWFTITMSSFGGHSNVPISWPGTDENDARDSFIEWLNEKEFQTVDFTSDGRKLRVTGRGSWVAGFSMDGKPHRRP